MHASWALFNLKYAGHIWKLTVAVDHLVNIVWIGPLMPGTAPDVIIWDKHGPSRKLGVFKHFEIGNHDGAYKGRLHSHTRFIGRKVLTKREREYNNVHGYYRACVEHLFARLWHWKVVRDIWMGSACDLHANTHMLLHFTQFQICWPKLCQPCRPWEHFRGTMAPSSQQNTKKKRLDSLAHSNRQVEAIHEDSPTLSGCSMVCIGKNVANCRKKLQLLLVMCPVRTLCRHAPLVLHHCHNIGLSIRYLFNKIRWPSFSPPSTPFCEPLRTSSALGKGDIPMGLSKGLCEYELWLSQQAVISSKYKQTLEKTTHMFLNLYVQDCPQEWLQVIRRQ